jgi:hypothetical protein
MSKRKRSKIYTADEVAQYATHKAQQRRAIQFVNEAVKLGLLPPAISQPCALCKEPATLYHHPKGYTGANALNVVALCDRCHGAQHALHPRPITPK